MNFLFRKPPTDNRLSNQANLAVAFGALSSRLVQELRTRTIHPDGRSENVAEHTLMLVKVATSLAQEYYSELDAGRVAIYASLHDDVEAYVGDTPTDSIAKHNSDDKKQREEAGLMQLTSEFKPVAPAYVRYATEYEAQVIAEARFVRVVDKIMVELIHLPNEGSELKKYYTPESAGEATKRNADKLMLQYPEYEQLIAVRSEIAHYMIDRFLR